MGRGLSRHQRRVLLLARESRLDRERRLAGDSLTDHERIVYSRGIGAVDLWRPEILRELYGWEPSRGFWRWRTGGRWNHNNRPDFGCVFFDPDRIGRAEYDRAQASLSRTLGRLEARGLIERRTRGDWNAAAAWLTEAGIAEAERLAEDEASPEEE